MLSLNLYSQSYTKLLNTGLENKTLSSVVTGDLNNDGYADIITTGINESYELSTSIYINDYDGSFTKLDVDLTPMYNATIALGDYNQDGFMDILISGEGYDLISVLWKNNGDLTFTEIDAGLAKLGGTNAEFRDIDNDGDLDILISGSIKNQDGSYSSDVRLYSNEGNDTFEEFELNFTSFANIGTLGDFDNDGDLDLLSGGGSLEVYPNNGDGSFSSPKNCGSFPGGQMKWFDFNNDGKLDFILSGLGQTGDEYFTKIYQNVGAENNWFSELENTDFGNPMRGKLDLRDYNSDGYLDLLLSGTLDFSSNTFITKIYDNSETTFVENTSVNLPQIGNGDGSWFDIDNDGDLDLILTGEEVQGANVKRTVIYRNDGNDNIYKANSIPSAPAELTCTLMNDSITFTWEVGSDIETATMELSFNLGVGTDSVASNILSPESGADGKRLIQRLGNSQSRTEKSIAILPEGAYFFKVQTIDGALAGSEFSNVERFAIGMPAIPSDAQATYDIEKGVIITWKDHSVNEFSFVVELKSNLNPYYTELGSVASDTLSFVASNLEDAIYTFRVKAINPNGETEYIETSDIAAGIPAAPSNFSVVETDGNVSLSWDDLNNERNYKLERSSNNGETYEELAFLDMDTHEYLDENPDSGTYTYRIQAINENGESDFVNFDITTGIALPVQSNNDDILHVYPNPAFNDLVYVKISDDHKIYHMMISDLTGKTLNLPTTYSNGSWIINFASVKPGIYLIKLEKEGQIISQKIIVD